MTSHVTRLYAVSASLVVFFLAWAGVAARPWAATKPDPALAALAAREQRLQERSVAVQREVDRRWQTYRSALAARLAATAAPQAAPVRVVTLPALTVTRSS